MTRDANPFEPYDADRPLMLRCRCGADHVPADHAAAIGAEGFSRDFIEATLVKALLPSEPLRRRFLQAVGATTARAAITSLLPLGALEAMAQEGGAKGGGPLEKRDLKIGFIAITCATPLIVADPLGWSARAPAPSSWTSARPLGRAWSAASCFRATR